MVAGKAFDAWTTLVNVYQAVLHETVAVLEGEAGIDSGIYSALAYLDRAQPRGVMPLAQLQALLYPRYSQPGFSRLVQRMERAGFVERSKLVSDGRAATLTVTATGRRRYRKAETLYVGAVHKAFGRHLDTAEAVELKRMLDSVIESRQIMGNNRKDRDKIGAAAST